MLSSQTKNKIYALISILVVALIALSFAATVKFLLEINNFIFSIDEKIIKEKTISLDKENFIKIKDKLIAPETISSLSSQPASTPAASPELTASPLPAISPISTPNAENAAP